LDEALFDTLARVNEDVYRNIKAIRTTQSLFDDLSSSTAEWAFADTADRQTEPESHQPLVTRPFDYGTVISYPFVPYNWQATRFSDGTTYGVWYGSFAVETTVYETAYHWVHFIRDSFADDDQEIIGERRVFKVHVQGLLVDLREKYKSHPQLVDPVNYTFTHKVGCYLYEQRQNGLLVKSSRHEGVNCNALQATILSNPRDFCFFTYRFKPTTDSVVIERNPGRTWRRLDISKLFP
jgi:hypothetical protein